MPGIFYKTITTKSLMGMGIVSTPVRCSKIPRPNLPNTALAIISHFGVDSGHCTVLQETSSGPL
jgi:hypothetical protein